MSNQSSNSHEISIKPMNDPIKYGEIKPDLNEIRKLSLEKIDDEKFGWFHIRTCLIAGIGFFTCAYDIFAINMVSAILGYEYFSDNGNTVPSNLDTALKTATTVGILTGQIMFGIYADKLGRKRLYGIELMIVIVATAGSTLAAESFAVSLFNSFIFWRVILGIGIGGDYPLSSVIMSEFSNRTTRGAMIAAVFAMQGFGILFAAVVTILTLTSLKSSIDSNILFLDYVWRIVIGVGIIPAVVGLYFRVTIPESPRWTIDVQGNVEKGARYIKDAFFSGVYTKDNPKFKYIAKTPKPTWKNFRDYFSLSENLKVLVAVSITWFVLDVAFYGIGLNHSIIYTAGGSSSQTPYQSLYSVAVENALSTLIGSVPGYWCSVLLIDKLGRKFIQLMGFAMLTLCYVVMGFSYQAIYNTSTFSILLTISMFFQNFGPNTTTFIIPSEVFPTRFRATCHGIAAASGKLGAIIAQIGFLQMKDIGGTNQFMDHLLQICAFFTFAGFFFTFLIPETKNMSLEENSNEEQADFIKSKFLCPGFSRDTGIFVSTSSKTRCDSPGNSGSPPHSPHSPSSDIPLRQMKPSYKVKDYHNYGDANNGGFGYRSAPEIIPNALPAEDPSTSKIPPSPYHTVPNTPVNIRFPE